MGAKVNQIKFGTAAVCIAAMSIACGSGQQFRIAPASETGYQQVTYNNKVDLLWVVDDSASMGQHQTNLSNQFGSFIDVLKQKKIDFNIAITSMDMGANGAKGRFLGTPSVITSSMPNAKSLFQSNIHLGESGSEVEQGLGAMKKSLSTDLLSGVNAGFLRADAQLAVIFITNEEDHSSGQPNDYLNFLNTLKPMGNEEAPLWSVNFIGITEPNGACFTRGDIADPGDRYMNLAQLSGGQIAEICSSDLSQSLSKIRQRIVERLTAFRMAKTPDVSSIRVSVNGVQVPNDSLNGWTYEDRTATTGGHWIVFHGTSVPAADARVNIDYQPIAHN